MFENCSPADVRHALNVPLHKLKGKGSVYFAPRMCGIGRQADAQANIIKNYIARLPGEEKLSAIYSCEQIAFKEADRLYSKIIRHNPDWKYGQPFDVSILDEESNTGLDIYI